MAENTAATETAPEQSDTMTPQEESQLHGEEKAEVKTPEVKKEPEKEKVVPYNALHEERMKRKETQKKLQETEARTALVEKRLEELAQRFKPQAPKYEDNPAAHLKHEIEAVKGDVEEVRKFREEQESIRKEHQKQSEFVENYRAQAEEFTASNPDFKDAYTFVIKNRFEELKAAGYKPEKIRQIINNEERMIVEDAFNDEANPAERIYSMAKARGYAKEKPEKSEAEKQIETVQKGLEASQTLSKGGGSSGGLTAKSLAEMSEDEFSKIDEATFRKLLGG